MSEEPSNKARPTETAFVVLAVARRLVSLPQRKFVHTTLSAIFIAFGAWIFAKNIPYFFYLNMGKMSLEFGHFDVAEDSLKTALAESGNYHHPDPRRIRSLSELGLLYHDECRYEDCLRAYQEVLELQQKNHALPKELADTELHIGVTLRKLGRLPEARKVLYSALQRSDEGKTGVWQRAEIQLGLGQLYVATGDYQDADGVLAPSCEFFVGQKDKGARLAQTALRTWLQAAEAMKWRRTTGHAEDLLAKLKIPEGRYSWLDFQRFGYKLTEQLLTTPKTGLLKPSRELHSMVATTTWSQLEPHFSQLASSDTAIGAASRPELSIVYVCMAPVNTAGFIPMNVVAERQKPGEPPEVFYLRYRLGYGVHTNEPILVSFGMLEGHKLLHLSDI